MRHFSIFLLLILVCSAGAQSGRKIDNPVFAGTVTSNAATAWTFGASNTFTFGAGSASSFLTAIGGVASPITTVNFSNTGLKFLDSNGSHYITISTGSNILANRTLTINPGDADRTITISANVALNQDLTTSSSPTFATLTATSLVGDGSGITGIPAATSLFLSNTGLKIRDTDASHGLTIIPGSNLTANRTFTLVTGDASMTLTLGADVSLNQDLTTSSSPTFNVLTATSLSSSTLNGASLNISDPFDDKLLMLGGSSGFGHAVNTVDISSALLLSSGFLTINPANQVEWETSALHLVTTELSNEDTNTIFAFGDPATRARIDFLEAQGSYAFYAQSGGNATISANKISGTTLEGAGSAITALNGTNITSGTVAVLRGGTGASTSTGSGSVVLSISPTFTGTVGMAAATTTGAVTLATSGGNATIGGGTTASEIQLKEPSASGIQVAGFKAPALSADLIFTLPSVDGTSGQALITNGSKVLSLSSVAFVAANISSNVTLANYSMNFVSTAAARSLTLPAPSSGARVRVKDSTFQAQTNNITFLQSGSEQLEGVAGSYVFSSQGGSIEWVSDGTNWFIF